jgi:hypothetical protein
MEPPPLNISLDLAAVHEAAERVRGMLLDMRKRFDLSSIENTKEVRIAPLEIPHSHPVLTLNTWVRDGLGLLLMYVHEQMHWYATWYSYAHSTEWEELMRRLCARYPRVPVGGRDGGNDEHASYLHLVVNWCEIDAAARFVGRDRVIAQVRDLPFLPLDRNRDRRLAGARGVPCRSRPRPNSICHEPGFAPRGPCK